ncbi:TIGR01244 family sulfur transferase [Tsuneonella sp. YG55]|uniref:TIGR01244 family sulfur transferase n=1 Tax=Tsuneonella litorea TaxID=2976475 RepID=A0A9X2VY15_9SPHN|nr:TIGR01244 family sulfur transferase [Tsuneonella litorea]MCT2557390.1 TIGR01244 family sulfur transferase [Tsuneonella litorea]
MSDDLPARRLTDDLWVRGQLAPDEVSAARDAGFSTIICNRPDGETPGQPPADAIRAAAEAAGIDFIENPIEPGAPTPDAIDRQGAAIRAAAGKSLAYCGSGQRATVLWMLANPHELDAEERIARAEAAGYQLGALRPRL